MLAAVILSCASRDLIWCSTEVKNSWTSCRCKYTNTQRSLNTWKKPGSGGTNKKNPWNSVTHLLVEIIELWIQGSDCTLELNEEAYFVPHVRWEVRPADVHQWTGKREIKRVRRILFLCWCWRYNLRIKWVVVCSGRCTSWLQRWGLYSKPAPDSWCF